MRWHRDNGKNLNSNISVTKFSIFCALKERESHAHNYIDNKYENLKQTFDQLSQTRESERNPKKIVPCAHMTKCQILEKY